MPKTIEEIARETGFSVTTVRLIANGQAGKYRISKATAKIVEEQIRRHGLVVNHAARSLKLRRTDTIGLVVPELSNAFFARLMAGLEELCRGSGLVLLDRVDQRESGPRRPGRPHPVGARRRRTDRRPLPHARLWQAVGQERQTADRRRRSRLPGFALSFGRQRQFRGRPRADPGRAGDGRAIDARSCAAKRNCPPSPIAFAVSPPPARRRAWRIGKT